MAVGKEQREVVLPVRALDGRTTIARLPAGPSVRDLKAALWASFPPVQAAPTFHLFLRGGKLLPGAMLTSLSLARGEFVPLISFSTTKPLPPHLLLLGDGAAHGQKPLFSARRSSILGPGMGTAAILVDLLAPGTTGEFHVNGSFPRRCCHIAASTKAWAAADGKEGEEEDVEVQRKVDEDAHVVMGWEMFVLWVRTGFDTAFAMGIVLVLDRITGDEVDGPGRGSRRGHLAGIIKLAGAPARVLSLM